VTTKRPLKLPVVLNQNEVASLIDNLEPPFWLMATLLYLLRANAALFIGRTLPTAWAASGCRKPSNANTPTPHGNGPGNTSSPPPF
jgi:hypothetical protein